VAQVVEFFCLFGGWLFFVGWFFFGFFGSF
jgi:hypothetical protein